MIRRAMLVVPLALVLLASAMAEEVELGRGGHGGGGEGYSQQFHYQSPGNPGHAQAGLSVDLSTGLVLAVGAIILLLAGAALLGGGGRGSGWNRREDTYGTYRNLNLASLSEKALNAVEKIYDAYNKN